MLTNLYVALFKKVLMTIERYLSIKIKKWRMGKSQIKIAFILAVAAGLVSFILNSSFAFVLSNADYPANISCYDTTEYSVWMIVSESHVCLILLYL